MFAAPCLAQQNNSSAAQGTPYNTTNLTYYNTAAGSSNLTGNQSTVTLPTGFGQLANVPGGLPETRLDSLVVDSGYSDLIYGDEGTDGPPPYYGFDDSHYIYHGMSVDTGLTTGHATALTTSWGWTNTMSNGPGVTSDFGSPTSLGALITGMPPAYDPGYGSGYIPGYVTGGGSGYANGYSLGYLPSPGISVGVVGPGVSVGVTAPIAGPVIVGSESGF